MPALWAEETQELATSIGSMLVWNFSRSVSGLFFLPEEHVAHYGGFVRLELFSALTFLSQACLSCCVNETDE